MDGKEWVTVNVTFKVQRMNLNGYENHFNSSPDTRLLNLEVLPDTEHLKEDKEFQKLVKQLKQAKIKKYDYINKNPNGS